MKTQYSIKSIKNDQGQITNFNVYEIGGSDGKGFRLVDGNKKPIVASLQSTTDRNTNIEFFDAIWIEEDSVFTLGFLTKEKGRFLGTLVK